MANKNGDHRNHIAALLAGAILSMGVRQAAPRWRPCQRSPLRGAVTGMGGGFLLAWIAASLDFTATCSSDGLTLAIAGCGLVVISLPCLAPYFLGVRDRHTDSLPWRGFGICGIGLAFVSSGVVMGTSDILCAAEGLYMGAASITMLALALAIEGLYALADWRRFRAARPQADVDKGPVLLDRTGKVVRTVSARISRKRGG